MHEKFIDIYDQYFEDTYRFILFKTGNRWDTDDLVSEVFRKALEKFETTRPISVKPWLMTIARNTVIDFYRRRREVMYGQSPMEAGYSQTIALLDEVELRNECLKQAILSLTPQEREMINLKYIGGLKYKDISEMVGKTEQWLKIKSHRIKQQMKTFILNCMEE